MISPKKVTPPLDRKENSFVKPGLNFLKRKLYAAYSWVTRELNLIIDQFILKYNNEIIEKKMITDRFIKSKLLLF